VITPAFDIGMAFDGLVLLGPLLFVVSLLIKLDSPGPGVFR
jgi:lipopolysaccharide/colanic/teichoic acid biosynthesis glycosyltransferase